MFVRSMLFNRKYVVEYLTSCSHICDSYYKEQTLSVSRIDTFTRIDLIADKFMALRISSNTNTKIALYI